MHQSTDKKERLGVEYIFGVVPVDALFDDLSNTTFYIFGVFSRHLPRK
jgi:hypothetical protein